jgi:hypothetical protein
MKRKALAVILISIIVIAGAIWLFLGQNQNQVEDQNDDQKFDVNIAEFEWTSNWGPGAVGFMRGKSFNITLQNMENRNIQGLSVDVILLANNTEILAFTGLYGPGIIGYAAEYNGYDGKLNANETREIRGDFTIGLDKLDAIRDLEDKCFKVRVMIAGIILDELTLPYT